jgi:SHS2 domain-containing protein
MSYCYLEDIAGADAAFEVRGKDLAELFSSAADATMNVMIEDLESIENREEMDISIENGELDMLLFNFIQELVFLKDTRKLLLRVRSVSIETDRLGFTLHASCFGEKLDPEKHRPIVDVKAVTLYHFSLQQSDDGWKATAVLDV